MNFLGAGGDPPPIVDTNTPTTGQTSEFDLAGGTPFTKGKSHRLALSVNGISLSGADNMVLEFRRESDSTWEQGAAAYRYKVFRSGGTSVSPTNGANMPIRDYTAGSPVWGVIDIYGATLAEPTAVESATWAGSAQQISDCLTVNTDIHDRVRLRITGAETYVSGTLTLVAWE